MTRPTTEFGGGSRPDRWWIAALGFLLLNVVLLAFYQFGLSTQAEAGRGRLGRRLEERDAVRAQRQEMESAVARLESSVNGITEFYDERLATEAEALTRIISEVKNLSTRAGVDPVVIDYSKETYPDQEVFKRTITFGVDGTYAALRRLINFLELSDSFLMLEEISLRGGDDTVNVLRINLKISTLFWRGSDDAGVGAVAPSSEAAR